MYNIIEIANTHGGSIDYIKALIDEFKGYKDGFGMKFQIFKYDEIACDDYSYYNLYKELFISLDQWEELFQLVNQDIWLDIFDLYGVEALSKFSDKIKGVKLQSSVLFNKTVLNSLSEIDLSDVLVVLNVSGYDLKTIENLLLEVKEELNFKELLLEVGFQAYPTEVSDSGLSKIRVIKEKFNCMVVFADHVDGKSDEAITLPSMALIAGADIVEKHVMHSQLETKYDAFSSVTVDKYDECIKLQKRFYSAMNQPFINDREKKYLERTIQIPVLKTDKHSGTLVSLDDLDYKRTDKVGLNYNEIVDINNKYHILSCEKNIGDSLRLEDFKKANIATIIACRLKSTRLKQKAKLKIGDLSSIELCIKNCLKFENVNHTILATSTMEQDADLENYTYRDDVIFHKGDPDDVIRRYLDIIDTLKIDIVVRITGDCPYLSNDILQFLLKSHFESGASYTCAKNFAVGTSMEIINSQSLRFIKKCFPNAEYSEYMTWYFQNNPEYFKLNFVDLPEKWIRDYRLTLDYQEDLDMFREIEDYYKIENIEHSVDNLFDFLDRNPEIASINKHLTLKYKTDQELIDRLNKATKINV